MRWFGFSMAAAAAAVSFIACSSSEADKYPSSESFCAARAQEECQVAGFCGTSADKCKSQRQGLCTNDAAQSSNAGRLYRASNAEDCITKAHNLYAKTSFTPAEKASVDYACGRVFKGNVQVNGPCQIDFDCNGDYVCDKGRCAGKTAKKLNEPCANPGEVCEAGTYCAKDGSGLVVCQAKRTLGQPCSTSATEPAPCIETARCAGTGVCETRVPQGGVCDVGFDQCAAEAPYCDGTTKKCVAQIIFAPSQTELCKEFGG